jgi:hypothetical protein
MPKSSKKQPVFVPVSYALSPALEAMQHEFIRARLQDDRRSAKKVSSRPHRSVERYDAEGGRFTQCRTIFHASAFSEPIHKLVLNELPQAMVALKVSNAKLGSLFLNSKKLIALMSETECWLAGKVNKSFAKRPDYVGSREWNDRRDNAIGEVVHDAILRMINDARYTRQNANMADVIKVRRALDFLVSLPALANVKIIRVKTIHDDSEPASRSRRANKAAVSVNSPVGVGEVEVAY